MIIAILFVVLAAVFLGWIFHPTTRSYINGVVMNTGAWIASMFPTSSTASTAARTTIRWGLIVLCAVIALALVALASWLGFWSWLGGTAHAETAGWIVGIGSLLGMLIFRGVMNAAATVAFFFILISLILPGVTQKTTGLVGTNVSRVFQTARTYTIEDGTKMYLLHNEKLQLIPFAGYGKPVEAFSMGETHEEGGAVFEKVGVPGDDGQPGKEEVFIFSGDLKPAKAKVAQNPPPPPTTTPAVQPAPAPAPSTPTPKKAKMRVVEEPALNPLPQEGIWKMTFVYRGEKFNNDFHLERQGSRLSLVSDGGTTLKGDLNTGKGSAFYKGAPNGSVEFSFSTNEGGGEWIREGEKISFKMWWLG